MFHMIKYGRYFFPKILNIKQLTEASIIFFAVSDCKNSYNKVYSRVLYPEQLK